MIKKNMDEAKKGFIKQLGGIAFKKVSENTYEFSGEVKKHLSTSGSSWICFNYS